jgi:hypothetical protein
VAAGERDREQRKAGAAGHADGGDEPDPRRRGQAAHRVATHEDQAAADEPHA